MIEVGKFNLLRVIKQKEQGFYLEDGKDGILLPNRFVPKNLKIGDELKVFVYHDSEDRLIATTQIPKAQLGDIAKLKVVSTTHQGAFLDWGLMKDIFVPKSQQLSRMLKGGEYIVKIYLDEKTGRIAATERIEQFLSNENISFEEKDSVHLMIYRRTQIGYEVIINHKHKGILHFDDVFMPIEFGNSFEGYIKKIYPDNKIDVMLGKPGYQRVQDETEKILNALKEKKGFLPFNDKTNPDTIYENFGMSKKVFKMTIGNLYKKRKILITDKGIQLSHD